jgi:PAS domain S-box-containing protein
VGLILNELRKKGVTDFETYFRTHPDVLETCIKGIRVTDVNLATMRMNHALNKPKFITEIQRKFTEDSQQIFLEEFVALASGRTYYQSEATTFEVEGEKLNVLFHMNVLPGHEEDLSLVLISVIDVSNLKRTEGQLSHIKELYRSVVEGQREMICRFLPTGKVTFYNSAFQHFFERKSLNLANLKFSNLTKANSTCAMELHNYRADGSMVWQQWEVRSLFNAKGEAVEYQAVGTDITNRKNAEDQLATSEARWRSIFENAEDLILTVNSSGLILTANEHVLQIEGLKLAGKLMTNLISKRYSLALSTAIQEVFERGNRVTEEIKLFRNTSAERIMSCVATPIFNGERVLMATIIARDITESRKLEKTSCTRTP